MLPLLKLFWGWLIWVLTIYFVLPCSKNIGRQHKSLISDGSKPIHMHVKHNNLHRRLKNETSTHLWFLMVFIFVTDHTEVMFKCLHEWLWRKKSQKLFTIAWNEIYLIAHDTLAQSCTVFLWSYSYNRVGFKILILTLWTHTSVHQGFWVDNLALVSTVSAGGMVLC